MSEEYEEDREDGEFKPSWKNRRRVIFGALFFCAGVVLYVLWEGTDSRVNETAITMSFFLAGSIIGSYVFSSTWESIGISKSQGGSSRRSSRKNISKDFDKK